MNYARISELKRIVYDGRVTNSKTDVFSVSSSFLFSTLELILQGTLGDSFGRRGEHLRCILIFLFYQFVKIANLRAVYH